MNTPHDKPFGPRSRRGEPRGNGPRGFRPPFPGAPFGPFEGFGPEFAGGFGGRRGRGGPRARRGDIRSAVLGLLAETPTNGYGLIRAISERTDDAWRPSPGSIYPTLAQLVDEGLIAQTEGARGPYTLTDTGRAYVEDHAQEIDGAFANARPGPDAHDTADLQAALRKLVMAMTPFLKGGAGAEQQQAAVAAVDTARRELHRILAE